MIDMTRQGVAYALIALIVAVAVPLAVRSLRRRHRRKLRQRGIKTYGH